MYKITFIQQGKQRTEKADDMKEVRYLLELFVNLYGEPDVVNIAKVG